MPVNFHVGEFYESVFEGPWTAGEYLVDFVCPRCHSDEWYVAEVMGGWELSCFDCRWNVEFDLDNMDRWWYGPVFCPDCDAEKLFNAVESEYECVYCG